MSEQLLSEFAPASYEAWRKEAEASIKGAPFDKKLISKTYEGIDLQPIYRAEDTADIAHTASLPGFPPYVRGANASGHRKNGWEICQEILFANPRDFNSAAWADLNRGLTALNIVVDQATRNGVDPDNAAPGEVGVGGISIATVKDLEDAVKGVDLEKVSLFVRTGASALPFAAMLAALVSKQKKSLAKLKGCIEMDPLGVLSHEGSLPQSLEGAYREMHLLTSWAITAAPQLQTICIHGRAWHEAGGSAVQEIAYVIATGAEYLREMKARGLSVDDVAPRIRFSLSLGAQFFNEIAKLRAARLLWSRIVSALGGGAEAQKMTLHVRTSLWNKSVLDPFVNMLRTTSEAFSGVLGGCDSMHVGPFDEVARQPDDFSRRIARNTQIILKDECKLDQVIDPVGGSWFVEWLTDQIARKSWAEFQEVEKLGGMFSAMEAGYPQGAVAKTAEARRTSLSTRRDVMVGVNQYANTTEKPLEPRSQDLATAHQKRARELKDYRVSGESHNEAAVLEKLSELLDSAPVAAVGKMVEAAMSGATIGEITRTLRAQDGAKPKVNPVYLCRNADLFEKLRAAADAYITKTGSRPKLFFAKMGSIAQHKARTDFSLAFFAVGGFDMLDSQAFQSPEEAAEAAAKSGASAMVICSTDETYPDIVPALTQKVKSLKPGMQVILAGRPKELVDGFKQAGVDEFIYLGANVLETVYGVQKKMGVVS